MIDRTMNVFIIPLYRGIIMSKKRTPKWMTSILFFSLIIYTAIYIEVPYIVFCREEQESSTEIRYEYDELNRIVKVVYPDGTIVIYEYDENGNITKTNIITPDQERTPTTESTIPEQTTADRTAAEQTTADQTVPEQTTADRTAAEQTTADRTAAEQTTADRIAAEQTTADHIAMEQSLDTEIPVEITSTENNKSEETRTENMENKKSTTEALSVSNMEDNGSRNADRDIQNWIPIVIGTAAAGLAAAAGVMSYRRLHGEKGADENEE